MRFDLMTRKRITNEVAKRYRKASKKVKGRMLDEFCALTGYNRSYAAWVLRKGPSQKRKAKKAPVGPVDYRRRGRKPVYTAEVRRALVKIWAILDCPCGKRLVAAMPETVKALERFGEIKLTDDVREKLLLGERLHRRQVARIGEKENGAKEPLQDQAGEPSQAPGAGTHLLGMG